MRIRVRWLASALLCGTLACISIQADRGRDGPAPSTPAIFTLSSADSTLWFVGFKNQGVAVSGSFSGLSGEIDVAGRRGWLEIPVGTLDTADAERNQNLITHLFAGGEHPRARFEIKNVTPAGALPVPGRSVAIRVSGTLTLRGGSTPLTLNARLVRETANSLRVSSREPLVLTSDQLGLGQAFAVLRAVCGHESLSAAVPIQFDLLFTG